MNLHSFFEHDKVCSGYFFQSLFYIESLATAGLGVMVEVSSLLRQSSMTSKEGRLWWSKDLCVHKELMNECKNDYKSAFSCNLLLTKSDIC